MYRILIIISLFCYSTNAIADTVPQAEKIIALPVHDTRHPVKQKERETLTLVSLNIAHGRKLSLNQLLVSRKQTLNNLQDIADFLLQVNGDIVALQEADAPSNWSGNFHHVEFLATHGEYPQYIHASHANIIIGHYGTGVMSRLPIQAGYGLTFPPSPPTTSKGLTLAEIKWQTKNGTINIDVISVHLDFSRETVRKQQLYEMLTTLSKRNNPIIIMGDFNSEWLAEQLTSSKFSSSLSLHTHYDDKKSLKTYKDKRLDWILVSSDLIFKSYEISPLTLSDHLAVIATVSLAPSNVGKL